MFCSLWGINVMLSVMLLKEDWRFSFEFKDACKEEIREHCVVCPSKHAEDCKVEAIQ